MSNQFSNILINYFHNILKASVLISIFLLTFQHAKADHLVGGTMVYDCLGNNNYRITLTIYRDCKSGTSFDSPASIGIFDANNNLINTKTVPFNSSTTVPIIINNPCLIPPSTVCIEKSDYVFTLNLPPSTGGYNIVYQRCCRNNDAINILSPLTMGSTYTVHIPGINIAQCNNSPIFLNPPPTIMCAGYQFNYDLSASDSDGDSLFYSFSDPSMEDQV